MASRATQKVIDFIEHTCGWDAFNRMCEDAPDISSRDKQEGMMRELIGAELYDEVSEEDTFKNLLTDFVATQVKLYIKKLYGRLTAGMSPSITLGDFETFIFEMFLKRA